MRIISSITLIFFLSCTPIHYLRKPLNLNPCIGASKRIIIAKDRMGCAKFNDKIINWCIDGLVSTLTNNSAIEIIEIIDFNEQVDSTSLMELKSKYNVDGVLLLAHLNVYFSDKHIIKHPCVDCGSNHYRKYDFLINTHWEYFDFATGNTYRYHAENGTSGPSEGLSDVFNDLYQQLMFTNGLISSQKLTGTEIRP